MSRRTNQMHDRVWSSLYPLVLELLLAGRWKFNPPLRFNLTLQMFQASKNRRFLAKRDNRFLCHFCFSWCKNAFWKAWVSWFQTFQSVAQEDYYFFLHLQREGSQAEWQQELWVTHFLKNSGKARVGGLSPNFIYVRFINKHMALLLGVPGAVWGHSLFCRFSPAVSRSPVCPLPPPCPPAAPGAICRVPSVDEDGVTTGWPGGSLRQPQSPSSVLSRRRKSFSKCQLHREFL